MVVETGLQGRRGESDWGDNDLALGNPGSLGADGRAGGGRRVRDPVLGRPAVSV